MFSLFKKISVIKKEEAAVKRAIAKVVDQRTHYGYSGHPHVKRFEEKLSCLFGGAKVLGMNSGTDAIVLALKLLGIGPEDEVIVPAFSFISTASPVPWVGAMPIFVDIEQESFGLDPSRIEEKITPKTKAIIVAHLFGQPALGIPKIAAIAKKHNLLLIEDAAQSFGAKINIEGQQKMVGTIGDIGCLSFSSTKPFSAPGNAGAVILNRKELLEEGDRMRFYGARKHYYDYPTVGVNSKIHEIQAAALLAKLAFFDHWLEHRRRLAGQYTEHLKNISDIVLPTSLETTKRTWYRYVIQTPCRELLFNHLMKTHDQSNPALHLTKNYPVPLPFMDAFRRLGCVAENFPAAASLSNIIMSLPITNYTTIDHVNSLCREIERFYADALSH